MKNKKNRYISYRINCLAIGVGLIWFIFLIAGGITAFYEGKHFNFVILGFLALIISGYIYYRWIYVSYKKSSRTLELFSKGYTIQGVFQQRVFISPEVAMATDKFREFMESNELMNATKKQAEFLALQNQINPHFLYNTLESIRGETLHAGLDSVANMMESLATYFRYTISNVENLVTLEDELANVENYYVIQKYRFGDRLNLSIEYEDECEDEIFKYKLPKLTLQPIVENAIYHGIERKVEPGHLRIKVEYTSKLLIITISDDGVGIEPEKISVLNNKLSGSSYGYMKSEKNKKGGIAIINVNNRIKLLFGEEYGISIYSTVNIGTDVEIILPLIEK